MISSAFKPDFSSPEAAEFLEENLSLDPVNCPAPSSALEWLSLSDRLKLGSQIPSLGHCIHPLLTKIHPMAPHVTAWVFLFFTLSYSLCCY